MRKIFDELPIASPSFNHQFVANSISNVASPEFPPLSPFLGRDNQKSIRCVYEPHIKHSFRGWELNFLKKIYIDHHCQLVFFLVPSTLQNFQVLQNPSCGRRFHKNVGWGSPTAR